MPIRFLLGLLLTVAAADRASAQTFSAGLKAGVRLTGDIDGFSLTRAESKRYIVGPAVQVDLPLHFDVEVDALYRTFGYSSAFGNFAGYAIIRERSNSWEFPLIGKYRIPAGPFHPFAAAGFNTRLVAGASVSSGSYLSGLGPMVPFFNSHSVTAYPVTHGLVVSGGVDWKIPHLRISPEVRYQRWNKAFLDQVGGGGSYDLHSSQNELLLILGVSWR